ncbi:MAG: imidazolonepropionase [Ignavibacteriales bacterium]|nr:imidazolonepropionase [Ignavibacteriales bacterium]MCF8435436.1 imidazolonepropionase [Ignavibacteriales bacterium]
MLILSNASALLTFDTQGKNLKAGKSEMNDIGLLTDHDVICEKGKIIDIIPHGSLSNNEYREIDLSGKTVMPGLVECHTHSAFAGKRTDEMIQRLQGVNYEEIARRGGGIANTLKSVRSSSTDELRTLTERRVKSFVSQGITSLEIKSGYGLSESDELKLLKIIKEIKHTSSIDIFSTFLGAHIVPPEFKNNRDKYIEIVTGELLSRIIDENLADYFDCFCEKTAFSAEETDFLFEKAVKAGLKLKLHTEQFNRIGGLETALKHKALSVDHLEVLKEDGIQKLAGTSTIPVVLPGVSYFLQYGYAPARRIIDFDLPVAIATDYNPGSSHISNISFIMSLALFEMRLTPAEILSAYTINAAAALDINYKKGSIEIGKDADFAVLDTPDYLDVFYNPGNNLNFMTISKGEIVFSR